MMVNEIIDHFLPQGENDALREILIVHSRSVAEMAIEVCDRHPELNADRAFVYDAAMLHDIGIIRCDATGIHCHGTEPYICHGTLGARMLEEYSPDIESITPYARVCARHTGTGLTAEAIRRQHLPLPEEDLLPETIEEKIICYADKFFSKTHLDKRKSFEDACRSLEKFGAEGVEKFKQWHTLFG